MSATYSNPASNHALKPLILHAMVRVIAQYPALSTTFMNASEGSKKPYYARIPQIDPQECVVFETRRLDGDERSEAADEDKERDQLLERYHNTRFDERWGELPLWRLVVLHKPGDHSRFVACFVWQHGIGDGHTGPAFHRAFQAELSALSLVSDDEYRDSAAVVKSPKTALPPSLESLHKLPLSPGYLLKMAWQEKFPSKGQALWLGAPITTPTRSRLKLFTLTSETTSNLLAICRAHSVTMTAAVHAMIAFAIFSSLPPEKTHLKSTIAVNLRRWLPSDALQEDEIGNYVSTSYLDHHRPGSMVGDGSWIEAQRIKKFLDDEVRLCGKNASVGCLKWVSNMHKYFASKTGQPREATFCLTNLGVFQPKDNRGGSWRTERMVFSESFDAAREAMDVTMITGEDGRLTLGLIWGDGVVQEELILKIFDALKISVIAAAGH